MVYAVTNNFTINWPYIAYQGIKNELMILNAFEQERVHRIQLTDWDPFSSQKIQKNNEISIQGTFISNTRDLFVLVYCNYEHTFYLYCLNLDECNFREIDERIFSMKDQDLLNCTESQMEIIDKISR